MMTRKVCALAEITIGQVPPVLTPIPATPHFKDFVLLGCVVNAGLKAVLKVPFCRSVFAILGTHPLSWFLWRPSHIRLVRLPNSGGISPLNW